ncbi:MAG TPA: ABC transporter ATP-binding protein, partial [Burkholderiales bacterium]|nr:ABC transporter ATP-binding protein [Burkholderiales bacterium]
MSRLLVLEGISKSFGALKVVDDVSLALEENEALGILGPNGAGKTTLFNLISGDLRPDAGHVLLGGEDITALAPHRRCRSGVGRSYQIPHPFSGMTVLENLLVAAVFGGGTTESEAAARCVDILARTGLAGRANQLAGSLTLLDRKRLELARALATRPRVLLLDEIAGGLTEHEARALVDTVQDIRTQNVAIIWIEHVVHALLACVERLVVLNFGALIAQGEPHAVLASP